MPAEIAGKAKKGALLIDSSTIDVDSARAAHAMAEKAGLMSVDAPVSGGTGGAKGATLTFMCGGADAAFAAAKPLLEKHVAELEASPEGEIFDGPIPDEARTLARMDLERKRKRRSA